MIDSTARQSLWKMVGAEEPIFVQLKDPAEPRLRCLPRRQPRGHSARSGLVLRVPKSCITHIVCHQSVNGVAFGCTEFDLRSILGVPQKAQQNYTGEVELLYGNEIYRCMGERFVECTVPDIGRFTVDGVEVLSVFEWLGGCEDVVEKALFRISRHHGIAYDNRDPHNGSITVFVKGRWDALLLPTQECQP